MSLLDQGEKPQEEKSLKKKKNDKLLIVFCLITWKIFGMILMKVTKDKTVPVL